MPIYVLQRTDQGGGYVARPGSLRSYTKQLEDAQTFTDRDRAVRSKCGNEIVIDVLDILRRTH